MDDGAEFDRVLLSLLRALHDWELRPLSPPRGVSRYRTLEDAQQARDAWEMPPRG